MNYTDLKTNIAEVCATTFTDDQLALFTQQAEQKIFSTVDLPALRNNKTGTLTASNKYLTMPDNILRVYSLAVVNGSGAYSYLKHKDVNFIREAYPTPTATGLPKYYAIFDYNSFILGPTPDSNYTVEAHYSAYPESLVTAGTTWLGDEFDSALLNGALLEAIRFMKGEPDLVALYEKMFVFSVGQLRELAQRIKTDEYRTGAVVAPSSPVAA